MGKIEIAAAIVLLAVVAGFSIWRLASRPPKPAVVPQPAVAPADTDPLLIANIKQHPVKASPITPTQQLGDQGGYSSQVVTFQSDGLTEYALMTIPTGAAPASGWPVIILCHGYIDPAQYRTVSGDYQSWIAALTKAGYVVLKPDFRGHDQSQGSATGGHFSPEYTYDVLNLMASLKSLSEVDGGHIGLIGHSMGAHTALRAAVVSPDVRSSVYVSGVVGSFYDLFYNWPRPPYLNDRPQMAVRSHVQQEVDKNGNPKSDPKFWDQASAINYVSDLKGPVQVHYGTADDTVPPVFSEHLAAALLQKHKSAEVFPYPGGDHQFTNPANRQLMLTRIIDLMNRTLH